MNLLEERECEDNPKHKALLADTEKVWRQLMELKRDPTEEAAARIREMITETNIVGRTRELNIPDPAGGGDF